MANTLTGLIPKIYAAMDTVSREQVGFIPAVSMDPSAEQAAVDQPIRSPVVPAMTASDISPSNTSSTGADRNISYVDMTINKQRKVTFHLTGEQEKSLGPNNVTIAENSFAQAFRTLTNEVESDCAATYVNSSRAYGTAGTTPFGTGDDLTDLTELGRILDDNGAPKSDRSCVLGSAAVAKLLGKQPAMFKVNEAGEELTRRRGALIDQFGMMLGASGQIKTHTKGTGTSILVNGAKVVGDKAIAADGGSGTILAGDVVTFAGDNNKYVVGSALSGGEFDINAPGLREALADNAAITVGNNYTANMAFSRDAIQLATRVPALPEDGDAATDRQYVADPVSGIVFEIAVYAQYRQVTYEVALCWGVKAVKPEHMATLLG